MKEKLKTDPLVTLCSNYLWELNYIERTHRSTQTRSQTHVYFFFFLTPGLVYAVSPPKLKSLIETLPLFTHTHTHTFRFLVDKMFRMIWKKNYSSIRVQKFTSVDANISQLSTSVIKTLGKLNCWKKVTSWAFCPCDTPAVAFNERKPK